ncbi:hypothetical protein F4780DRAFT_347753 [Xylariomycetidae sp. FL0641]|nr:hypothetical protein F4780DRAFT_347753 [Xylariomycetidae sp. FL0641]
MDEPGYSWPAWKFGMKRTDLHEKLHHQYNTLTFSIQDPDAFQNDVCEISHAASSPDEFHLLLAQRKELRLRELNESLESASLEIIANPTLIGTQQWQHAVQLFRTRSFDSLVRYFASYLPAEHPWNTLSEDPTSKPFFDELDDDVSGLTHEPLPIDKSASIPSRHLPPSPRSLSSCSARSDNSSASTPARNVSFSESDPEVTDSMTFSATISQEFDEDTSQPDDFDGFEGLDTPTTTISDISETHAAELKHKIEMHRENEESSSMSMQVVQAQDNAESDTPTPTPQCQDPLDSYRFSEQTKVAITSTAHQHRALCRAARDQGSGWYRRQRKAGPDMGHVRKPLPNPMRTKPKGRRLYGG